MAARMRGSSAAENSVQVPPPLIPMQPTRVASSSLRVAIQSIVRITSCTRQPIMVWPSSSAAPVVYPDDIVYAAPVTRHAHYSRVRRLGRRRGQQVSEHVQARGAFKYEF